MTLKLTKNELRTQQHRQTLLLKYLPTLQLKKALLQSEVAQARSEIEAIQIDFERLTNEAEAFSPVLTARLSFDLTAGLKVKEVKKRYDNIAGVEVPYFEAISFEPFEYTLLDTPPWVDIALLNLKELTATKIKKEIAEEKKSALEKELREVSIRVNLFEKILIPRAQKNIKKIKVFLGDQLLASVARAKVAKSKVIP